MSVLKHPNIKQIKWATKKCLVLLPKLPWLFWYRL